MFANRVARSPNSGVCRGMQVLEAATSPHCDRCDRGTRRRQRILLGRPRLHFGTRLGRWWEVNVCTLDATGTVRGWNAPTPSPLSPPNTRPCPVCSMWPVWEKCIDVNVWKQWWIIPVLFFFIYHSRCFCCCRCYYCCWTFIFSGYKILHSFLYTFSLLTCYLFAYCFSLFSVQFLLFKRRMENETYSWWLFCAGFM